ncbi:hypothetical protein ACOSQ3_026304 [Xanthoceras sorbifolium]
MECIFHEKPVLCSPRHFKLNVDESVKEWVVCIGTIVRFDGYAQILSPGYSIEVPEALAMWHGVLLASQAGFSFMVIESHALSVVRLIASKSPPLSDVN